MELSKDLLHSYILIIVNKAVGDYKYNISTIKLRVDSSSMNKNPHKL